MTEANFERSLRALSQRQPFKAFRVELASGAEFTIDHPEVLARRGPVAVYINPDGEYTLFDNTMVTQLPEASGNASKRSRKQN
jgi:hypothetical protein